MSEREDAADYYARLLEAAVKAAAITALLLPAMGVAVRLVSFRIGGVPGELAVADSVPSLAYQGLQTLMYAALWSGLGLFYWSVLGPAYPRPSSKHPAQRLLLAQTRLARRLRLSRPITFALGVLVLIVLVVLLAPLGVIPLLAGLAIARILTRWAWLQDGSSFRTVIPTLMVGLALLTVYNGIVPNQIPAVFVRPIEDATLPRPGWYNILGRDDTWTYAWECGNEGVVAIRTSSMAGATFAKTELTLRGGTTIFEVASGVIRFGFAPNCPPFKPGVAAVAVTVAVNAPGEAPR